MEIVVTGRAPSHGPGIDGAALWMMRGTSNAGSSQSSGSGGAPRTASDARQSEESEEEPYDEIVVIASRESGRSGTCFFGGVCLGFAGVFLPYADGTFGFTSKGEFRFYSNGWSGNQHITTYATHAAKVANVVAVTGAAATVFSEWDSLHSEDSLTSGKAKVDISLAVVGVVNPFVGLGGGLNSLIGEDVASAVVGAAIRYGPQPSIGNPRRNDRILRNIESAWAQ